MNLELVEGWSAPIRFKLKIGGILVSSFSTQDVAALILRTGDGVQVDTTGEVVLTTTSTSTDPHNCVYTPSTGDLVASKTPYRARFRVTNGAGQVQYWPHTKADQWLVNSA